MSNEILHRAKRTDTGEWVEGYLLKYSPIYEENTYILPLHSVCASDIEVDPKTVCQYTGLTDKNGRKIFEGDIVNCKEKRGAAFWHCRLADRGCPIEVIQELMGHSDSGTTSRHYIAKSRKRTQEAWERHAATG